jgi:hypothetical protein
MRYAAQNRLETATGRFLASDISLGYIARKREPMLTEQRVSDLEKPFGGEENPEIGRFAVPLAAR